MTKTHKKAARGSCNYDTRQTSTSGDEHIITSDDNRAYIAAAVMLAATFGACMMHWAVVL